MKRIEPIIPPNTRELIRSSHANGRKNLAEYSVRGKLVGRKCWDDVGRLGMEYQIRDGKMHGVLRDWHGNGILSHQTNYVDGKEHGVAKQYDKKGRLIGTYRMIHGTGLDLWFDSSGPRRGQLVEERDMKDGMRHGFERWWLDSKRIWREGHFWENDEHGIFRDWNSAKKLCRGYPKYYVNGRQVTKRLYLRACLADDSLPKFVEAENRPYRKMRTFKKPESRKVAR